MKNVTLGFGWTLRFAVGFVVLLGAPGVSHGQILIDDFNDGNDDGWTRFDNLDMGGGPGIFDAASGAYNIRSTGLVPPVDGSNGLGSGWGPSSSDAIYSNGHLRAKIRNNVDRTDVVLAMRVTEDSGYFFDLSNFFAEPRAFLGKTSNGEFSFFDGGVRFPSANKFTDWNIEAGVVGNQLSMKVWPVGDPEPPAPQLMVTDPTPLPDGAIGVVTWLGSANPSPLPLDATFDDIYFTPIPEPSTLSMGLLALMGLAARSIRRRLS